MITAVSVVCLGGLHAKAQSCVAARRRDRREEWDVWETPTRPYCSGGRPRRRPGLRRDRYRPLTASGQTVIQLIHKLKRKVNDTPIVPPEIAQSTYDFKMWSRNFPMQRGFVSYIVCIEKSEKSE